MGHTNRKELLAAFLFLLPNLAGFLLFLVGPTIGAFFISTMDWALINDPSFTGLANFQRLVNDSRFWITLRNTAYYVFVRVPINVLISLVLAVLLNQNIRGRNFFRTLLFIPVVLSLVSVAIMWRPLVMSSGVLNQILARVGIGPIPWITSSRYAMPTIIMIGVWREIGYFMVIFLAGLQSISSHYYEAARIDGASGVQQFLRITIPLVSPTTFFISVVAMIWSFQIFDLTTVLTGGGPRNATNTLVMYIYQQGFQNFRMGYAAALGVVLFFIVLTLTVIQKQISSRWVHY
ncbi:MAG: sugar ABC transporter permease [Spirochaetaceae bacterium]|nr:MAG: sugar ABC transporter permease [Spirochaetaceae bacterium]TVQ22386.1 MAG: sugar ABC transporter permease [Spirochaetaceae bacterium]